MDLLDRESSSRGIAFIKAMLMVVLDIHPFSELNVIWILIVSVENSITCWHTQEYLWSE